MHPSTTYLATILRNDTSHVDLTRALAVALAVAARAVQLAEVLRAEAVDGHGRGGVVLDDLVVGVAGAAALDHDGAGALEGEGVFADVGPPDVW